LKIETNEARFGVTKVSPHGDELLLQIKPSDNARCVAQTKKWPKKLFLSLITVTHIKEQE